MLQQDILLELASTLLISTSNYAIKAWQINALHFLCHLMKLMLQQYLRIIEWKRAANTLIHSAVCCRLAPSHFFIQWVVSNDCSNFQNCPLTAAVKQIGAILSLLDNWRTILRPFRQPSIIICLLLPANHTSLCKIYPHQGCVCPVVRALSCTLWRYLVKTSASRFLVCPVSVRLPDIIKLLVTFWSWVLNNRPSSFYKAQHCYPNTLHQWHLHPAPLASTQNWQSALIWYLSRFRD